jgi:hypothetical protein
MITRMIYCLYLSVVAAVVPSNLGATHWLSISPPVCSQTSTSFGDTSVTCSGFSKTEYRDTITFYASATCEGQCGDIASITTYLTLVVGVSGPCTYPVSYSFWGGVASPKAYAPYVYANNYSSNRLARVEQSSSKDCDQVPAYVGPGSKFPYPC